MQTLTLIRGIPGSGKSTLAADLWNAAEEPCDWHEQTTYHLEADMFFVNEDEEYKYNVDLIKQAHAWCQGSTAKYLNEGYSVIVSNTFVKPWELQDYIRVARTLKIPVKIIHCKGEYKNVHGVPDDKVSKMKRLFQSNDRIQNGLNLLESNDVTFEEYEDAN